MGEPACHEDAMGLLRRAHIYPQRIVSVDVDSILFLSSRGEPATAWLIPETLGRLVPHVVSGFQIDPPGTRQSTADIDGA